VPTLSPGQIIADKYRIDSVIGTGGMGVVLAATHVELEQRVAIKLLRDASDDSIARFKREARLLVKLRSEHVARVFDVGALDDDTPYIVMELLEGHDLAKLVELQGRLSVEQAVDYVLEATEAVAEAHVLGMVHRDLKPANLFLARGPGGATTVKVLDFGISKMLDVKTEQTTAGALTNEGVALGSPGYMAPEQITSSRDVDVRADIYSLGAMLYRLVSGRNPYKGASLVSVLASMAIDPLPPLASLVPDVPEGFARAVERCLAQEPDARFPTVAHFADAFVPFATRRGRDSAGQILATMGPPAEAGVSPHISLEPHGATIVRPILPSVPGRPSSIPPPPAAPVDRSWMTYAAAGLVSAVLVVGVIAIARPKPSKNEPAEPRASVPITSALAPPPPPTSVGTVIGSSPVSEPPPPSASQPRPATKPPAPKPRPPHPHGPPTAPVDPLGVPGGRH
jgi:eukaryotic-like serine/threonine-protein kinase